MAIFVEGPSADYAFTCFNPDTGVNFAHGSYPKEIKRTLPIFSAGIGQKSIF